MTEQSWEPARLIPVSGINGPEEQERRGVSALMAVVESVREFGRAITSPLGAPGGSITTFIEVSFPLEGRTVRPDGLIRVVRGGKTWTALVEVKTGRNDLGAEQVENYLDVAREQGFDAVLTISNQLVSAPGEHPTDIDRRKCRKVNLYHLSWSEIHTEAVIERVNRSVADPDQAWILSELIRYLEHTKSGAQDFDDMGAAWVPVREATALRTLRSTDKNAAAVVDRYGQLVSFAAMRLSRDLGVEVRPVISRADLQDRVHWTQSEVTRLVDAGTLQGALRVPNAVAPFTVTVDLRASRASCSISIDAPSEGRSATRVNWLLRQLSDAPDQLLIEATTKSSRRPGSAHTLAALREDPRLLIEDPTRELKTFTMTLGVVAGTKRGQGRGSFVGSVLDLADRFYAEVVQTLRPYSPSAPKVKQPLPPEEDVATGEIVGELPVPRTPPVGHIDLNTAPVDDAEHSHDQDAWTGLDAAPEPSSDDGGADDLDEVSAWSPPTPEARDLPPTDLVSGTTEAADLTDDDHPSAFPPSRETEPGVVMQDEPNFEHSPADAKPQRSWS